MTIRVIIFWIILLPTNSFGQIKQIFFSEPFNKLIIGQTSLKQTKKVLGKPTKTSTPPIIQHKWEKRIELDYADSKSTLRFGKKRKILYNITLDSGSTVILNNKIKLNDSDTSVILETFGTPKVVDRNPVHPYFFFELNPYDVYFSFNEKGILNEASFFPHLEDDIEPFLYPDDSVFKVIHCNQIIYSVDDFLIKEKVGELPKPDDNPSYCGGISELKKYFMDHPLTDDKAKQLIFRVSIAFVVNCTGEAGNFQIVSNGKGELETYANQVLAVANKMPQSWQPATKDSNKVDCYQVISFTIINGKLDNVTFYDK